MKPILLLEDDDLDAMILTRALRTLNVRNEIIRAEDGEKGLSYLLNDNSVRPYLILLDLNMPKMNGLEFLKKVKNDPKLRMIPIVVITTSERPPDIDASFENGASGYMIKNPEFKQFVEILKTTEQYWRFSKAPSSV